MKSVLALFLLFSVFAHAQENKPTETASLSLNKVELMEWENIQLKGAKIQRDITDLQNAMHQLEAQLADLNKRVLAARKLDAKEYAVNQNANPPAVVKIQKEEAKK